MKKYSQRNLNGTNYKDCVPSQTANINGSNNFIKSSYGCAAINNYSAMVRKISNDFCATRAHCTTVPFRCSTPLVMINTLSRTMDTFYKYTAYVITQKKPT
jgi:hypothetical protein